MNTRTLAVSSIAAATLLAVAGCSATNHATSSRTVALGAGDELGQQIRSTHIVLTGRDAFDRDEILQTEAVRIVQALQSDTKADGQPIRFVNEPIILDMP